MVLNKTDKGGCFIIRSPIRWTEKTVWASEESPPCPHSRTAYTLRKKTNHSTPSSSSQGPTEEPLFSRQDKYG